MNIPTAIEKLCRYCEKSFPKATKLSIKQWERRVFCSTICQQKGRNMGGKPAWNRGLKTAKPRKCEECSVTNNRVALRKKFQKLLCDKHYYHYMQHGKILWGDIRPTITTSEKRAKGTVEHAKWRKAVFERDDYRCQICGERGGKLEADHIKPFKYFPKLRTVLSNGRTLCVSCHKKTDTYGRRLEKKVKAHLAEGKDAESFFESL